MKSYVSSLSVNSTTNSVSDSTNGVDFHSLNTTDIAVTGAAVFVILLIITGLCIVRYRSTQRLAEEVNEGKSTFRIRSTATGSTIDSETESIHEDIEDQAPKIRDSIEKYVPSPRTPNAKRSVKFEEQYSDPAHQPTVVPYYVQSGDVENHTYEDEDKFEEEEGDIEEQQLTDDQDENVAEDSDDLSLEGGMGNDLEKQAEQKILDFYSQPLGGGGGGRRSLTCVSLDSNDHSIMSYSTISYYPTKQNQNQANDEGASQRTGRLNYDDFSNPSSKFSYYFTTQPTTSSSLFSPGDDEGHFLTVSASVEMSQRVPQKSGSGGNVLPQKKANSSKQIRFNITEPKQQPPGLVPECDNCSLLSFTIEDDGPSCGNEGNKFKGTSSGDDSAIWIRIKSNRDSEYPLAASSRDIQII